MTNEQSEMEPKIIGYVTPLRARPGEELEFKVSSADDLPFSVQVVRIDCADPNPAGPGMKLTPADFGKVAQQVPGKYQPAYLGSYGVARVLSLPQLKAQRAMAIDFEVQPWLESNEQQVLLSLQNETTQHGFALYLQDGRLNVGWVHDLGEKLFEPQITLDNRKWYRGQLLFSRGFCRLTVQAYSLGTPTGAVQSAEIEQANLFSSVHLDQCESLVFAAVIQDGKHKHHFNGRMGNTRLWLLDDIGNAVQNSSEQPFLFDELRSDMTTLSFWDFSANTEGFTIPNKIKTGMPIQLFNAPMRAVRGLHWDARYMDWTKAPEQYAAVHFHADDLADCGWETSLRLTIPEHVASAVYGLVIQNEKGSDCIPFFVIPPKNGPHAKVAYLASTYTYLAYGNHARGNYDKKFKQRVKDWQAYPFNPDEVGAYGYSTYNKHPDGYGISLSSRLRPLLSMRPGYLTFYDENGSGMRHFPADTHLIDWLRIKRIEFDVITDEDLHEEGLDILKPYSLLLTGSHPEYHTREMIDALLAFRQSGGHLAYFGANGFYWKIAVGGPDNSLLEVRRAEGGIRAWASEPGEYYNQLDGGYGGLWRRNGIAPQMVGAVGFAVQGFYEGSPYRRTAESYQTQVSWIFDGVESDLFGGYGLSGGGAAGFELDQVDPLLGTPENTHVIAVSEGHGPSFKTVPEEVLIWTLDVSGTRPHAGICAHMTYTEPSDGMGSIFATGSITFLGSLSHNNYENDISTIVENYIKHCLKY